MNKKFIIEYYGGCRGDFLCNFLNYNDIFIEFYNTSKSMCVNNNFKRYINQINLNPENIDINQFEVILKEISEIFIPSHHLFYLQPKHYELLEKHNFEIYKIVFSKKWYNNIVIENFFKNYEHSDFDKGKLKNFLKHPLTNKIKFFLDFYNHSKNNNNKTLIDYDKLYYDISILDYFPKIDLIKYKNFLKSVELKKEIEIDGIKYYPADYGYVWNESL